LWLVVHDDDVVGAQRRRQDLLDIERNRSALTGPSISHGASTRSWRKAAIKVMVFHRRCGILA
jgi:hypothetical protein